MKPTEGSEDLARRLCSLYRTYGCEHELPDYYYLVVKLSNVEPEVRDAVRMELDRDYVYPISYEEAEKSLDEAAKDEERFQNLAEVMLENIPDAEKKLVLEYLLGKTAEAAEKDAAVKEFRELYNNDARHVFKGFKADLNYFLKI